MSDTFFSSTDDYGRPDEIVAFLEEFEICPGTEKMVPRLCLRVGRDSIKIWPADQDALGKFGKKIIELANDLREKRLAEVRKYEEQKIRRTIRAHAT